MRSPLKLQRSFICVEILSKIKLHSVGMLSLLSNLDIYSNP